MTRTSRSACSQASCSATSPRRPGSSVRRYNLCSTPPFSCECVGVWVCVCACGLVFLHVCMCMCVCVCVWCFYMCVCFFGMVGLFVCACLCVPVCVCTCQCVVVYVCMRVWCVCGMWFRGCVHVCLYCQPNTTFLCYHSVHKHTYSVLSLPVATHPLCALNQPQHTHSAFSASSNTPKTRTLCYLYRLAPKHPLCAVSPSPAQTYQHTHALLSLQP